MSRIVIANSVGIDRNNMAIIHSPSRWTNSSKDLNVFTYYPWELAYTSALLKRDADIDVVFIDGCLKKYRLSEYYEKIAELNPDYILMEPATRTWEDDSALLKMLKERFSKLKILVAGQHATAFPEEVSKVADYVLIGEYEYTVLDIVSGKHRDEIKGLYPNPRRELLDVNTLPWPEDDDVPRLAYGVPGEPSSEYLEIQAYATRGCPMSCNFCVCRHLYYNKPNWRPRDPKDVVAELKYLREKYPEMEGIFFDEEFHNVKKDFILALTDEIVKAGLNDLKIEAMCAYYTLDEEMMDAMKRAGYYLLRVGIETAGKNAALGMNLGAKFNLDKLMNILRYAKKIGLKMYGTFTFGAPGSTKEDDEATLELMDKIIRDGLLWRFQTSICTPQPGSPFYKWAEERGFLKRVSSSEFDGGNNVVLEYSGYSSEEIMANFLKAQKYFDMAVLNRFKSKIDETKELLKKLRLRRILVIRSSRPLQVEIAVRAIKEALPDVEVDMVLQKGAETLLKELVDECVDDIFFYGGDFFSAGREAEKLADVVNKDYDAVFLIYNNLRGRGYSNVEEFVSALGFDNWIAFNSEGALLNKDEIVKRRNIESAIMCGC